MLKMLTIAGFALAIAVGPAYGGYDLKMHNKNGTQLQGLQVPSVERPNDATSLTSGMQIRSIRLPDNAAATR
jgi:hypothetical protein